jgi:hypothetical protein
VTHSADWIVYDWSTWEGFLAPGVLPGACRIPASPGDDSEAILARVPTASRRFLFHLNLSRTLRFPVERAELCRLLKLRGVEVWNEKVVDVTRRALHSCCCAAGLTSLAAERDGDPAEILIVKTDLNYGGKTERLLSARDRQRLGIPELSPHVQGPLEYRVLPRREIPEELWSDPALVMERYVRNSRYSFFRAYRCGGSLVVSEAINPEPIQKMRVGLERWNTFIRLAAPLAATSPPPEVPRGLFRTLLTFLAAFSLDFGALDLVMDDAGQAFVIDVNPTPYWGREIYADLLGSLREGAF